jgi:hypothetical protein
LRWPTTNLSGARFRTTTPFRTIMVRCATGHSSLSTTVGDMNEIAARLEWADAGVRAPRRFISPRVLRLAVERAISDERIKARAREFAAWSQSHDPGVTAARLVERLATA